MTDLPLYRQSVSRVGASSTVVFADELDLSSRDEIQATLLGLLADAGTAAICVDLEAVGFLDSTALAVFVSAYQDARNAGKRFAITAASTQVSRVLRLTGLEEILTTAR
jgi:anti-anti-sigma factor